MRVRVFETARRDIAAAVTWWRANRPAAAQRLEEELARSLRQLEELPYSGPQAKDTRLGGFRRLPLLETRYWLYYLVNETKRQVEVLRFWHMSRRRPRLSQRDRG
jgi:plasmid stabilization system protein ParE